MSAFAALQVTETIGRVLEQQGYSATDSYLSEVVPTAARGHNLVAVTPPAALHAVPGLAGAINALAGRDGGLLLMLVPEAALEEWEQVTRSIADPSRLTLHTVRTIARASRMLLAGTVNILLTPPDAALLLVQRSVLKTDNVTAVFMAWPELWDSDESLTPLMQDVGREVQRIIYTTQPDRVASLVERHARRAHTVAAMVAEMAPRSGARAESTTGKAGQLRLVTVAWNNRQQALQDVIELLDPPASTVWTLSTDPDFLPDAVPGTTLLSRELPEPGLTITYDLPTAGQLAQLTAQGDVVLLVPPSALTWVRRVLPTARDLRLIGPTDIVQRTVAIRREQIARAIETPATEAALLALAPLFERHDAELVAAALYQLWQDRGAVEPGPPVMATTPTEVMQSATARVWVGVGKKDAATANDFVGVLTKELRYDRAKIGKIEVRELYTLIEVPATDAEMLAGKLNGVTIRRRRVTARLDRGGKVKSGER
jgi:ATP-dependent RNA helicase DeaD